MPYRHAPHVKKPSEIMDDLLSGKLAWDDADDATRSWAQLAFYDAARQIMGAKDKAKRDKMLARVPAGLRPMVEAEIKRLRGLAPR